MRACACLCVLACASRLFRADLPAADMELMHSPPETSDGFVYLYAIYFTLATTTTIGFGDVTATNELEVGVMCCTICFSALLYSSLIAYMSNLILASDVNCAHVVPLPPRMNAHQVLMTEDSSRASSETHTHLVAACAGTAHKQKVETIKSFMRHRKIPTSLQARIEEYLDYLWTTQKGLDETEITSMLPATLRQQLSLFCNSRIISTVPLFAGVPSQVSAAIVAQLQPRIFVPDDTIITRGDWVRDVPPPQFAQGPSAGHRTRVRNSEG